jgi:hypothetical protein
MFHQSGGSQEQPWPQAAAISETSNLTVTHRSPPAAKIKLFRSFFRGREDVYPRRFESRKTGKSGYTPACANEWVRGVCEKLRIKCTDCPNRRFFQITDEVIGWHLSGRDDRNLDFVMGVYAMLLDETFFFGRGLRWRRLAAGCDRVSRNVPAARCARRLGTLALRQWGTCVVIL